MLKLSQIGLLICLCMYVANAQAAFSVDTTYVSANHPADAAVFYPWIVLTNKTPAALPMVCVMVQDQKPSAWETWLEDLDSAYTYVPDTSRFVLPTDTTLANYLIVSFHPNDVPGRATVVLKVYPDTDPSDSVLLTFDGKAYRPITGIEDVRLSVDKITLYPQPAQGEVVIMGIDKQIATMDVCNTLGQIFKPLYRVSKNGIIIDIAALEKGLYFVWLYLADSSLHCLRLIKD